MSKRGRNQLGGMSSGESLQELRQMWQSADVGTDFLGTRSFLVSLALRDEPTKMIYATLELGSFGPQVDIPLAEHTSEEELRHSVNLHPTLWGDIDPAGYSNAIGISSREKLLAFLNRTATAASTPSDVPAGFYDMLGISHGEAYGAIHVGSHGGRTASGYNFNATLESLYQREFDPGARHTPEDVQVDQAMNFAALVEASLPHLTITPLSIDRYIEDARVALEYIPRE